MGNGGSNTPDYGEDVILENFEKICLQRLFEAAYNALGLSAFHNSVSFDDVQIKLVDQNTDEPRFELEFQFTHQSDGQPSRFSQRGLAAASDALEYTYRSPVRVGPKGSFEEEELQPIIFYVPRSAVQAVMEAMTDIN